MWVQIASSVWICLFFFTVIIIINIHEYCFNFYFISTTCIFNVLFDNLLDLIYLTVSVENSSWFDQVFYLNSSTCISHMFQCPMDQGLTTFWLLYYSCFSYSRLLILFGHVLQLTVYPDWLCFTFKFDCWSWLAMFYSWLYILIGYVLQLTVDPDWMF